MSRHLDSDQKREETVQDRDVDNATTVPEHMVTSGYERETQHVHEQIRIDSVPHRQGKRRRKGKRKYKRKSDHSDHHDEHIGTDSLEDIEGPGSQSSRAAAEDRQSISNRLVHVSAKEALPPINYLQAIEEGSVRGTAGVDEFANSVILEDSSSTQAPQQPKWDMH